MFKLSLKSSTILAVALAVILTTSIVFILKRYALNNRPSMPVEQIAPVNNFTKEIVIKTDKTEYEKYETIKVVIKNNSDEETYLSSVSFDAFEYKINEEWIMLKEGPVQKTLSYVLAKVFPKEEIIQEIVPYWIWNSRSQENLYRIQGVIYFGCKKIGYPNPSTECVGKTMIRSNEFKIKEEKDFSDCDLECKKGKYLGGSCRSGPGAILECGKNGISIGQSEDCKSTEKTSGAWRTCCCQMETPEELSVQTDKIKYATGETVNVEIKNRSFTVYNIIWPYEIQRKYKIEENIDWEVVYINPDYCLNAKRNINIINTYRELPGDKAVINTQWNQKEIDCNRGGDFYVQSEEGTYKMKITLAPKDVKINKKTDLIVLYSNEFVVREDKNIVVDFYSCNEDSDCVKVKGDVCGCNSRGTADAINKKFEQEWRDKLKAEWQKDTIACLQIISEHSSCFKMPICVENKCVLN